MARQKIICFGELVVDCFGSVQEGFSVKFGGAVGNTAVGLGKLGHPKVWFAGKVGKDFFADFLETTLRFYGVNTRYLVRDHNGRTTLAFVALSKNGQRDFSFFSGAHDHITPGEVRRMSLDGAAMFQFGSLTQSTPEAKSATRLMLNRARQKKVFRSYDPNVRLALWPKPQVLQQVILSTLPSVDAVKVNEEELVFLTGQKNPKTGARKLWRPSMQLVVVTLGAKGAFWMTKTASGTVPVPKVKAIDTTGAGDAFNAGLWFMLEPQLRQGKLTATDAQVKSAVEFATTLAALSTLKKGAVEGLPTIAEVRKFQQSRR